MAQFPLRFQGGGTGGQGANGGADDLTIRTTLNFGPNPDGGTGLVAQIPGLSDVSLVEVELALVSGGAGEPSNLHSFVGETRWFVEIEGGSQTWIDNNGDPALRNTLEFNAGGPITAGPSVHLDGLALAAFPVAPVTVTAKVRFAPRFAAAKGGGTNQVWSSLQGVRFLDTNAGDNLADPLSWIRKVETSFGYQTGAVVNLAPANAAAVRVQQCGQTAFDPRIAAWISTSDVGVSPGQVPPSFASNTAEIFRYHPAAFWTPKAAASQRVFELTSPISAGIQPIDTQLGAPPILVIDGDVRASRWLLVINGTAITTVLVHPAGSQLRRPRDIWNAVIVPAINASQLGGGLVLNQDEIVGNAREITPSGVAGDLLNSLTFARFLEPLGLTDTDVFSLLVQV